MLLQTIIIFSFVMCKCWRGVEYGGCSKSMNLRLPSTVELSTLQNTGTNLVIRKNTPQSWTHRPDNGYPALYEAPIEDQRSPFLETMFTGLVGILRATGQGAVAHAA
jgi:hypothetical protein